LPPCAWKKLERPPRYVVATKPRQRPTNVKDRVVRQRKFDTLRLQSEEVAEFNYRPTACREEYRMVVVRKNNTKEKGELRLHVDRGLKEGQFRGMERGHEELPDEASCADEIGDF
jgi:hypothetical protein